MDDKELKRIVYQLRSLINELESVLPADPLDIDYDQVIQYYQYEEDNLCL